MEDDDTLAHAVAVRPRGGRVHDVPYAYDGEAGLAAVAEEIPSLLVPDIRIPKLDGLTVPVRLRESSRTRDIPAVVHSASACDDGEGLDTGATTNFIHMLGLSPGFLRGILAVERCRRIGEVSLAF